MMYSTESFQRYGKSYLNISPYMTIVFGVISLFIVKSIQHGVISGTVGLTSGILFSLSYKHQNTFFRNIAYLITISGFLYFFSANGITDNDRLSAFCLWISMMYLPIWVSRKSILISINLWEQKNQKENEIWTGLSSKWGIQKEKYYFPLNEAPDKHVVAWHIDSFIQKVNQTVLDDWLKSRGDEVVICLPKEFGKMEYSDFRDFQLNTTIGGSEMVFTNNNCEWFIYTSHEKSITLGGDDLIKFVKSIWTDWDNEKYSW